MTLFPTAITARPNFGPRRIRGAKESHHEAPSRSAAVRSRGSVVPSPKNPSELFIASLLCELGLKFYYEPLNFPLTLTGKGKLAIRPDFYVRKYDVYLEVTQGNEINLKFKLSKIRNAHQLYPGLTIILIGPAELAQLSRHPITLLNLINSAIKKREATGRKTFIA